jgi:hypothetical protein
MEQHKDEGLLEKVQWLKDNHYLIEIDGSLVWTEKTKKSLTSVNSFVPVSLEKKKEEPPKNLPAVVRSVQKVREPDSTELWDEFIKAAEVPTRLPLGNGSYYWANRYNMKAAVILSGILRDPKINNQALIFATKLYYKQENTARQTIGNYLTQGTWRSCYQEFAEKAASGAESLEAYIRENMNSGNGQSAFTRDGNE